MVQKKQMTAGMDKKSKSMSKEEPSEKSPKSSSKTTVIKKPESSSISKKSR